MDHRRDVCLDSGGKGSTGRSCKVIHERAMNTLSMVELLRRPSSYPGRPPKIEVRETHISWVFLAGSLAYKLKKPVKFDFLDFSTPQLRRRACEDELRLNRRLAPDVYLAVVPVTAGRSGKLAFQGDGAEVDWVVKMRRLPDDRSLNAMIAANSASPDDINKIAQRLTRFYQDLPPISMRPEQYRRETEAHVHTNRRTLLEFPDHFADDVVKRVHTAQLRYLHSFPEVFDLRVCDGRIVEGHGDLRPEHTYLLREPVVIDCIEFSSEFRRLDVLDELCFLAMECNNLEAAWIGGRIIEQYIESSGDRPPRELRAFYTSYRACVRAKVNLLRASQLPSRRRAQSVNEAARYLQLADHASHPLGPPAVLIVRGPAGVGKTTLAEPLAGLLGTEYIQTDAVRRELFGPGGEPVGHNEGRYSVRNRRRVYQAMFERADKFVSSGLSVVLDGTFLTNDVQRAAANLATRHGAQPLLINCACLSETASERITQRRQTGNSFSDAQVLTHQQQRQEEEPPPPDLPQCDVDTSYTLPALTRVVLDALKSQTCVWKSPLSICLATTPPARRSC